MSATISAITGQLYKKFLKPILFTFDPEKAHHLMVNVGITVGRSVRLKNAMKWSWAYQNRALTKKIDGIYFPNPVGLSAGFDYNADLVETVPAVGFGFHTIGTITLEPYEGNPIPRLTRFPKSKALLVNKGLKNSGAPTIIEKLQGQKMTIPTGISIASTNKLFANAKDQITDIVSCFRLFEQSELHHAYYELNISCPNTFGGEPFTTPVRLKKLLTGIETLNLKRPVYVKMPIDLSIDATRELLNTIVPFRVKGVIFGNLTKDKTNPDIEARDFAKWQRMKGNFSGKPTWRRSNQRIALAKAEFGSRFTIIGTGGIFSGSDALRKMELGADLVQLITGMIYEGPQLIGQINRFLITK